MCARDRRHCEALKLKPKQQHQSLAHNSRTSPAVANSQTTADGSKRQSVYYLVSFRVNILFSITTNSIETRATQSTEHRTELDCSKLYKVGQLLRQPTSEPTKEEVSYTVLEYAQSQTSCDKEKSEISKVKREGRLVKPTKGGLLAVTVHNLVELEFGVQCVGVEKYQVELTAKKSLD